MNKVILSNRIYLRPESTEHTKNLMKALTYRIEGKMNPRTKTKPVEIIKNYKVLPNGVLSLPQGRTDLIPEGWEVVDKRVFHEVPFPLVKFGLRESQQIVHDEVDDTCLINALVGWGKTATALHIARKLGQKTLVITHTTALRDQWIEEVEKFYGHSPGIIGSGKYDIEDHFIVVGNVQTLTKFTDRFAKEFGTVILDECLDYETKVSTLEYGDKKLGSIVNGEIPCHVKSIDIQTGKTVYKKVLRYFKNPQKEGLKISHSGGGSLKATLNHSFFILDANRNIQKIKAEDLKIGDYLLQDTDKHKSTYIINKEWYPILLGLILGDGSLNYPHKKSDSIRLSITHGEDQEKYFRWKRDFLLKTADPTEVLGKSGYSANKSIFNLNTKSFYDIEGWKYDIYLGDSGSKINVPKILTKNLTKESWALIYQDDGSTSHAGNSITFSFCEFDEKSCINLIDSLKSVFSLKEPVYFKCNHGFSYIRLNKEDSINFKLQISSLIHPSLYYKLKGIDTSNITFDFKIPNVNIFNEYYCVREVTNIEPCLFTGGNRYNIEVEDTHTYFANGILVSNCHHCPATSFSNILDTSYARYRIGLSGTLNRTDGKHILFKDYFGSKIHKPPQSDTLNPVVKLVNTGIHLTPGVPWVNKMNNLLYDEDYQQFVTKIAKAHIDIGHSVLIIADRVEFLNNVKENIGETCVLITGETDFDERKTKLEEVNSGKKMCIAGSRQIFSEGISVNRLSCVILAVPTSNPIILEQIIGRIMRLHPEKLDPVVIDLQFSSFSEKKQNSNRLAFYASKGWKVIRIS